MCKFWDTPFSRHRIPRMGTLRCVPASLLTMPPARRSSLCDVADNGRTATRPRFRILSCASLHSHSSFSTRLAAYGCFYLPASDF